MTLRAYLASLKEKQIAVLGVGVSNLPLLRLLADAGISVTPYDRRDREKLRTAIEEPEPRGVRFSCGEDYLAGLSADVIFRTPGMRPDVPEIAAAMEAFGYTIVEALDRQRRG